MQIEFLAYIVFLLLKEVILTFLAKQLYLRPRETFISLFLLTDTSQDTKV